MDPFYFARFTLADKLAKIDISASRINSIPSTNSASPTTKSQPNLKPQLPAQPNPNPNNRPVQSLQIIESSEIEPDLQECNDLQLRSGRIIETEGHRTTHIEDQLPIEQPSQQEDVNKDQAYHQVITSSPPFPE